MASVNKVILVGNLGRDPEVRYAPSGDAVCMLNLATTDKWKDKNTGEAREATEWHRIVFYGKPAEIIAQYTAKGSPLYVEGALTTRKWQDKEGRDRYTTEIKGREFQFLGGREGAERAPASQSAPQTRAAPGNGAGRNPSFFDDVEDDIPF